MNKISTNLWFDTRAEEAVEFYLAAFGSGKISHTTRYSEVGQEIHGQKPGSVMTVDFEIFGHQFTALNGGPLFKFNPSISFIVNCNSAVEVSELWEKLSDGDSEVLMELGSYPFSERYGWLNDKYGVSWQLIVPEKMVEHRIVPSLMFVGDVCGKTEEAIEFYVSVFKDAHLDYISRYGADKGPDKEDTVIYADFTLEGQKFAAMDSARKHDFGFNEAVSFIVNCKDQEEIDYYWEKLSAVPEAEQCGWLKDKYGVSWQIIPAAIGKLMETGDEEKDKRAFAAMMQMKKLNIAELEAA